jgi:hypothetical protein
MTPPTEVFAEFQPAEGRVVLHFVNPLSGLSTPLSLEGFPPNLIPLDHFSLTQAGVIFRDPRTGGVQLASPDGQARAHPFIPQQPGGWVAIDWVLSPDRGSIAWVEVYPSPSEWLSVVYIADAFGREIIALPPQSPRQAGTRLLPLSLTDDRQLLFLDMAAPLSPPGDLNRYFPNYQDIWLYAAFQGGYQALPGEPACDCGAGIGAEGFFRFRFSGGGMELIWWDLAAGTEQGIPTAGPRFAQGGDFYFPPPSSSDEGARYVFYSLGENLEDTAINAQFALMRVDLKGRAQQMLLPPSGQRFRVLGQSPDGGVLTLGDVYGGASYKLILATGALELVSEDTWLGQLGANQ